MDDLVSAGIKAIGAFGGGVLALIYHPPKARKEAAQRLTFCSIGGFVACVPFRDFVKWPDTTEYTIAAAMVTAAVLWWAFGAVIRILGTWKPK